MTLLQPLHRSLLWFAVCVAGCAKAPVPPPVRITLPTLSVPFSALTCDIQRWRDTAVTPVSGDALVHARQALQAVYDDPDRLFSGKEPLEPEVIYPQFTVRYFEPDRAAPAVTLKVYEALSSKREDDDTERATLFWEGIGLIDVSMPIGKQLWSLRREMNIEP
jgi:hypothetical protein